MPHCHSSFGLFKITNAPITPGTQAHKVNIKTITIEPQPLSYTASGGNKTDNITLQMLIVYLLNFSNISVAASAITVPGPKTKSTPLSYKNS